MEHALGTIGTNERVVHISIDPQVYPIEPMRDLELILDQFSQPSFHESNQGKEFVLTISNVTLTSQILALLVQLLNHSRRNCDKPSGVDLGLIWDAVCLSHCQFLRPLRAPGGANKGGEADCMQYYTRSLVSTLTRRVRCLTLDESPEIFSCLSSASQLLEVQDLRIIRNSLSEVECSRLTDLVKRSIHLKKLWIAHGSLTMKQRELWIKLPDAFHHLQLLVIHCNHETPSPTAHQLRYHNQMLTEVVCREGGALPRLLQHPQCQLKELVLNSMHLGDWHFMAIVQALPTSHLEKLTMNGHRQGIKSQGILELARQLPRMQCLKGIRIPMSRFSQDDDVCVALCKGFEKNVSLEEFEFPGWGSRYKYESVLRHYATINRAGRRIFATSKDVPLGLWPLILERAATTLSAYDNPFFVIRKRKIMDLQDRASAVYFLLQNCPIVMNNKHQSILTK